MRNVMRFLIIPAVSCLIISGCKKPSEDTPSKKPDEKDVIQATVSGKPIQPPFPLGQDQVSSVTQDLARWVVAADLQEPERNAFDEFCVFLAARRHCDSQIYLKQMTNDEAVTATQPIIDNLAARGQHAEAVLLQLLEARKSLETDQRTETLCGEDPEIFATIVLWKMKSKKAVPLFIEMAQDARLSNRAVFVRGLRFIGDERAIPLLQSLAKTETNREVMREALMALTAIPKVEKRTLYVQALLRFADPEVLRFLRGLAADEADPVVRKQAESAVNAVEARLKLQQQPAPSPILVAPQPLRPATVPPGAGSTPTTVPVRITPKQPPAK